MSPAGDGQVQLEGGKQSKRTKPGNQVLHSFEAEHKSVPRLQKATANLPQVAGMHGCASRACACSIWLMVTPLAHAAMRSTSSALCVFIWSTRRGAASRRGSGWAAEYSAAGSTSACSGASGMASVTCMLPSSASRDRGALSSNHQGLQSAMLCRWQAAEQQLTQFAPL